MATPTEPAVVTTGATYAPKSKIRNADTLANGRSAIVEVAVEAFAHEGFHETSVDDIAAGAGITVGGLYKYVRSKHDILFLVLERQTEEIADAIMKWTTADVDPVSAVRSAYADYLTVCDRRHKVIIIGYRETHLLSDEARAHILIFETRVRDLFLTLLRRAVPENADRDHNKLLWVAADDAIISGHMWAVSHRVYSSYLTLDEYIALKTQLMMDSLRSLSTISSADPTDTRRSTDAQPSD